MTGDVSAFGKLGLARFLTGLVIILAAVASAAGIFVPGIYRETAWVVPQNRGQDLLTLAALVVLAGALVQARRGSARAVLIWIGVLGYVWYTYVGAAFVYRFNELFLVYVALFSLSTFTLIAVLVPLDAGAIRATFDAAAPRRAVGIYLVVLALILAAMWLSQVVAFLIDGTLPDLIVKAQAPTNYVFVLDLGVVVPLSLIAAIQLWRDRPWGYVLASAMLIKAATMGLALLSMTGFAAAAGQAIEVELLAVWLTMAASSLGIAAWFLRNSRSVR
jgi:hypothetical protein